MVWFDTPALDLEKLSHEDVVCRSLIGTCKVILAFERVERAQLPSEA